MLFLWPALAAASTSELASVYARGWAHLAGADEESPQRRIGWTTQNRIAVELPTMDLRDFSTTGTGLPRLVCAPFALHTAVMADFAPGHSLIAALRKAGQTRLFLTDWRSATEQMRFLSIDSYLSDLNVAVDELGGQVDLIGLCQGGWMALLYAARFPGKVRKLVLAGAPIDIGAGASSISRISASLPLSAFEAAVKAGGGRVFGDHVARLWGLELIDSALICEMLQLSERTAKPKVEWLESRFRDWYHSTFNLPGTYYLQVVDWIYKQNRLAEGRFVALGHRVDLTALRVPIFMLAANRDELVAPEQVFATARRVGTPANEIRKAVATCRHLGLFLGTHTLARIWPEIAQWLGQDQAMLPALRADQHAVSEEAPSASVSI